MLFTPLWFEARGGSVRFEGRRISDLTAHRCGVVIRKAALDLPEGQTLSILTAMHDQLTVAADAVHGQRRAA